MTVKRLVYIGLI